MKILVVDDDPQILDAVTVGLQLQWQDATVLSASDGEQGCGGQDAYQDRLLALIFGKAGGGEADNDRVIAGKHQIDHHDLEKSCEGL